jgi:hypothetical protein
MEKKFKTAKRLAGLVVYNTKKPAYIHYDVSRLKFLVSTKSHAEDHMLIEKVVEEIIPCVDVIVSNDSTTRKN